MRAQHTAHPLPAYPVYSCTFIADDLLVAGGGGGASRSGIKNKLVSWPPCFAGYVVKPVLVRNYSAYRRVAN